MESKIIDYYNELPSGINVIDKMNDELSALQDKLSAYEKIWKKFQMPRIKVNSVEEYKEYYSKLEEFITFINTFNDEGGRKTISSELLACNTDSQPLPQNLELAPCIMSMIDELNELTNNINYEWCKYRITVAIDFWLDSTISEDISLVEYIIGEEDVLSFKEPEVNLGQSYYDLSWEAAPKWVTQWWVYPGRPSPHACTETYHIGEIPYYNCEKCNHRQCGFGGLRGPDIPGVGEYGGLYCGNCQ